MIEGGCTCKFNCIHLAMILKNKLKLRSSNNPSPVRNVFITPDYTPLEQKKNKALCQQLDDMNKVENVYTIKNGENSAEITTLSVPRNDNHLLADLPLANDLTSLTVNCQSLLAKKESFLSLLDTYNPDIIFGTESWLKPDILSSEVFPVGHSVYRRDRSDGYGGVLVTCREHLISCSLEIENNHCELVAYQVKLLNNGNLIVYSAYRPPSSSDDYLNQLCNHLESIKSNHPNSEIWISGDNNLPDINWEDNCVEGHQYSLTINNTFLEFLNDNGFSQIVDFPTRRSNTLDIFVTNRPSLVESCKSISGISDHEVVLMKSIILAQLCPPARRCIYL